MKPGELRRFHDDAFPTNDKHLNGTVFMIVSMRPGVLRGPDQSYATILVDGTLDDHWHSRTLEDMSEPVNEAG